MDLRDLVGLALRTQGIDQEALKGDNIERGLDEFGGEVQRAEPYISDFLDATGFEGLNDERKKSQTLGEMVTRLPHWAANSPGEAVTMLGGPLVRGAKMLPSVAKVGLKGIPAAFDAMTAPVKLAAKYANPLTLQGQLGIGVLGAGYNGLKSLLDFADGGTDPVTPAAAEEVIPTSQAKDFTPEEKKMLLDKPVISAKDIHDAINNREVIRMTGDTQLDDSVKKIGRYKHQYMDRDIEGAPTVTDVEYARNRGEDTKDMLTARALGQKAKTEKAADAEKNKLELLKDKRALIDKKEKEIRDSIDAGTFPRRFAEAADAFDPKTKKLKITARELATMMVDGQASEGAPTDTESAKAPAPQEKEEGGGWGTAITGAAVVAGAVLLARKGNYKKLLGLIKKDPQVVETLSKKAPQVVKAMEQEAPDVLASSLKQAAQKASLKQLKAERMADAAKRTAAPGTKAKERFSGVSDPALREGKDVRSRAQKMRDRGVSDEEIKWGRWWN